MQPFSLIHRFSMPHIKPENYLKRGLGAADVAAIDPGVSNGRNLKSCQASWPASPLANGLGHSLWPELGVL